MHKLVDLFFAVRQQQSPQSLRVYSLHRHSMQHNRIKTAGKKFARSHVSGGGDMIEATCTGVAQNPRVAPHSVKMHKASLQGLFSVV